MPHAAADCASQSSDHAARGIRHSGPDRVLRGGCGSSMGTAPLQGETADTQKEGESC